MDGLKGDLLLPGEYEYCEIRNFRCPQADLSDFIFRNCTFLHCDFSMIRVDNTTFSEVVFKECKLTGTSLQRCAPLLLSFRFEHCVLGMVSFFKLKLKNTGFTNCDLTDADFAECDLTGSSFSGCNLQGTRFEQTRLEKVDFTGAQNLFLHPDLNTITGASFTTEQALGLLVKYKIRIVG
ncbi:MAG: pentapeptide repeat-containing protein [Bacteroidetes bacterium]|nr:pentapeptide repeat-containing protein [Bacteroidota bacterium]